MHCSSCSPFRVSSVKYSSNRGSNTWSTQFYFHVTIMKSLSQFFSNLFDLVTKKHKTLKPTVIMKITRAPKFRYEVWRCTSDTVLSIIYPYSRIHFIPSVTHALSSNKTNNSWNGTLQNAHKKPLNKLHIYSQRSRSSPSNHPRRQ